MFYITDYKRCLKADVKDIGQRIASVEWDLVCNAKWPSNTLYVDIIVSTSSTIIFVKKYERLSTNRTAYISGLLPFKEYQVKIRTISLWSSLGWESDAVKFVTAQAGKLFSSSLDFCLWFIWKICLILGLSHTMPACLEFVSDLAFSYSMVTQSSMKLSAYRLEYDGALEVIWK